MEELIREAPAPIPQLEERVSAWQLSPVLDRNPKLHCSSTFHLQPLSSPGVCQMPVCAERLPASRHKESWKKTNIFHFPAYQSQAAQSLFAPWAQASRADYSKVQQGTNNLDAATKGQSLD